MKTILILIGFVFVASNINAQTASMQGKHPLGGGDGTEENPYQIYTKEHLEELADSVNTGYNWSKDKFFHLMSNIDDSVRTVIGLGPTSNYPEVVCLLKRNTQIRAWKRIKDSFQQGMIDSSIAQAFQGYFNGRGHKITLAINMPTQNNIGLFGCVSGDGLILDLDVDGYVIGKQCVGGFVGYIRKSFKHKSFYMISECRNYATITSAAGENTTVGGIVGVAVGSNKNTIFIDRCVNHALVNDAKFFHFDNDNTALLEALLGSVSRGLVVNYRSIYQ